MSVSAIAKCGSQLFVIKLSEDVYALVNSSERSCVFARLPDSFYKQGFFEPYNESGRKLRHTLGIVEEVFKKSSEDNIWKLCLGRIDYSEIKNAVLSSSKIQSVADGGPGSGNFGHAGRPGEVGGSAPEDGGSGVLEAEGTRPKGSKPAPIKLSKNWMDKLPENERSSIQHKIENYGSIDEYFNSYAGTASKLTLLRTIASTTDWFERAKNRQFSRLSDEEEKHMSFLLDKFQQEDAYKTDDAIWHGCSEEVLDYYNALKAKELGIEGVKVPPVPEGLVQTMEGRTLESKIDSQSGERVFTKAGDAHRKAIREKLESGHLLKMDYAGIPKEYQEQYKKAIIESVDHMDDRVAELVAKTIDKADVGWFISGTSNFNPSTGQISIFHKNKYGQICSPERMAHVFWHEYGHFVDSRGAQFDRDKDGHIPSKNPLRTDVGCSGVSQLVNGPKYVEAACKDVQALFDEAGLSDKYEVRPGKPGEFPVQIYRKSDGKFIWVRNTDDIGEDIVVITNAINNTLRKKLPRKFDKDAFLVEQGMPKPIDRSKYFKTEYKPELGASIIVNEELYEGARDAFFEADAERDRKLDRWVKKIGGMEKFVELSRKADELAKEDEERRKMFGATTDCLDESVTGLFGMVVQWGGHEADYYYEESHPNETAANTFSVLARNNPDEVQFMKSVIPNIFELFTKGWRVR